MPLHDLPALPRRGARPGALRPRLLPALLCLAARVPVARGGFDAFSLTPSSAGELNLSAVPAPLSQAEFGRAVAVSADGLWLATLGKRGNFIRPLRRMILCN